MPQRNGTGPNGEGPFTGRGMGYCMFNIDSTPFEGFAGIEGKSVTLPAEERKEVTTMPAGDRTGPAGMGPMTGRGAGYCAGYGVPGYMNPGFGRGLGRGFGRGVGFGGGGRGRRNWYYATGLTGWQRAGMGYPVYGSVPYNPGYAPTKEQEMEMLKEQAKYLEDTMSEINKRISELEAEKK